MAMMHGSGFRPGKSRFRPTSEINITPFVDVMLVLLIIFMVAAPLLTVTVPVDLPEASKAEQQTEAEPLTVTVTGDGKVFVGDSEVSVDALTAVMVAEAKDGTNQRIYVRGDRTVNYERVIQVMGLINAAGFNRLGLIGMTEKTSE